MIQNKWSKSTIYEIQLVMELKYLNSFSAQIHRSSYRLLLYKLFSLPMGAREGGGYSHDRTQTYTRKNYQPYK